MLPLCRPSSAHGWSFREPSSNRKVGHTNSHMAGDHPATKSVQEIHDFRDIYLSSAINAIPLHPTSSVPSLTKPRIQSRGDAVVRNKHHQIHIELLYYHHTTPCISHRPVRATETLSSSLFESNSVLTSTVPPGCRSTTSPADIVSRFALARV